MKRKLVFATNNAHKLEEISAILGDKVEILSLKDIHCQVDIPETADTLEGNSLLKAQYIREHYGMDCFADDTGLEVEALNGAPGVYSARYAGGEGHDSEANMRRLLKELEEKEVSASAGGGAVEVTVTGKKEVTKVKLDPEAVDPDDVEMLEDLIMAATNEALRKADEASAANMAKLTGGLGGGLPF